MIKVNADDLSERLKRGVEYLERYGFLEIDKSGILVKAVCADRIAVEKDDKTVTVMYDTEPHFYMALARSIGMSNGTHPIDFQINRLGLMLDCSRNAVPKPDMVKRLICFLVLTGYTYLELYTEETYELPDEPYWGYMRGRYRKEELEEIVAFADMFGFEMVPCIQALAHLGRLSYWVTYLDYMDIDDILLVGDERTYQLIRKCIRFCKEVFHTRRINIGTDEAFRLGRGKYIDRYGYKSKQEIYLEHLKKVFAICKEEGMDPEFWADAFYETECDSEDIQAIFDGSQTPIFWDYTSTEKQVHRDTMMKLKNYAGHVTYAGGLWKWIGYAPDNTYTERVIRIAFEAARECQVQDILMTAWGDNGNECSIYSVIPSMWYATQQLYSCEVDIEKVIFELTGYTRAEWMLGDRINRIMPNVEKVGCAGKYILHNDYLIGVMDYHIPDNAGSIYQELAEEMEPLVKRNSQFQYIFQSYYALCQVLTRKATYGKRLRWAYQENDRDIIDKLLKELQDIKKDLTRFYNVFRVLWMKENKGFGFEIMDVRIGGLITRADTVAFLLEDYLAGRTERIYELEEERLPLDFGEHPEGDERYSMLQAHWLTSYTVNSI